MGLLVIIAAMVLVWAVKGDRGGGAATVDGLSALDVSEEATPTSNPALARPGEVVWAFVPFSDASGDGKVRPVYVLSRSEDTIRVFPLYSRQGPTTSEQTYVFISPDSTRTFDLKAGPSWILVAPPLDLPSSAIAFPGRQPGTIKGSDERRLKAVMGEYGLRQYLAA